MTAKRLFPRLLLATCLTTTLPAFSQQPAPAADPTPPAAPAPPASTPAAAPTAVDASPSEGPALPMEGLVRLEVFTLSQQDAHAATRKFPKHTDLYAWLGAELEKEKPIVKLERLMVLRVRAGQKSKLEEISDYPVPTETSPPEASQTNGPATAPPPPAPPPAAASADGGSLRQASTTPINYGFRSAGWTAEIELCIREDNKMVDVNLAAEFARFCGMENHGDGNGIKHPVFETSTLTTMIMSRLGQPTLAGTLNPPSDAGVEGGNTEKVTRLLFLTVTDPH